MHLVTVIAVSLRGTSIFIALIHPIQWTIALPVSATGPAKRQKKTSCIDYRQDRSGECIRQVAHRTSSSCLDIESEDVFSRQANFLFYTERNPFILLLKLFRSIIYNYVISRTKTRFMRTRYGWVRLPLQVCTL